MRPPVWVCCFDLPWVRSRVMPSRVRDAPLISFGNVRLLRAQDLGERGEMAQQEDTDEMEKEDEVLCGDCELDKAGGAWFLTGWLKAKPRVVLRLTINKQGGAGDPFDVLCEVRRPSHTEFETVASFAALDQFAVLDAGSIATPDAWRSGFLAMFRKITCVLGSVDLASCDANRYAAEPLSSRDYLAFGAADDMPLRR